MFGITFTDTQPRDWRDLFKADWDLYETITNHMIENGVMPDPDGFEPYFLCVDHTVEDAAETVERIPIGSGRSPARRSLEHIS